MKFHRFQLTTFHGLVYCDYCSKLLWGLARQGVQCAECGYHCHESCKDMALQCRPPRRVSPDSLSVTDSEAESIGKPNVIMSPRGSLDIKPSSTASSTTTTLPPPPQSTNNSDYLPKRHHTLEAALFAHQQHAKDDKSQQSSPSSNQQPAKAYRKALKHAIQDANAAQLQMSPHQTAKTFTRLVARSRAFFHMCLYFHNIYTWRDPVKSCTWIVVWTAFSLYPAVITLLPPICILLMFFRAGIHEKPANMVLLPRYDESSPEYYVNLERMQSFMVFLIRLYDNLSYHLQHASLNRPVYRLLFVLSCTSTILLYFIGRYLMLAFGLLVLLNQTRFGIVIETILQLSMEMAQTLIDAVQFFLAKRPPPHAVQVSLYENQRWWTGTGYTAQLLRNERTPWSNITGTEPLPSKDDMPPPSQYQWADDTWQLDMTGPWVDDRLNMGKDKGHNKTKGCAPIDASFFF
ncbi:integral peroxisomal membrane peroxin-domain-containing protein [Gongronella butleri]|nr:integral peroxisomal membrane peroxin-domain-containing protein [Gongronella butleri]